MYTHVPANICTNTYTQGVRDREREEKQDAGGGNFYTLRM